MKLFLPLRWPATLALIGTMTALAVAQQGDREGHVMEDPPADLDIPPAPVVPPDEALATFEVEEGFELQLVAAEPLVHDPVCMAWDEDGRLWVCEMRGYMLDADGSNENDPIGYIVILDDTDGDGVMDTRTVFLEGIVLPRAIGFAKDGMLYADQNQLYFVRINPDGTAGARRVIDPRYSGGGNVEHRANGLLYGLDNWYYNAKSRNCYQLRAGRWLRTDTEDRGQWGITQDDLGRLLANDNSNFIHGELLPPGATIRNPNFSFSNRPFYRTSRATHPVRVTPGVNRGYQESTVSHETWKLVNVTGASGPVIYRGDQFPDEYYGNVFIPEPVGNLLKRVVLTEEDGRITATHAYADREFVASHDERSRFVNTNNAPDGTLYIVDMYRGIIQHKEYVTSFLRRQIEARGLAGPVGLGRIYRVVYTGNPVPDERPAMSSETSEQLVEHLRRRNAWWRHTAQRVLVQRRDPAAVPALKQLAADHASPLGQTHALWTLDGIGELDIATLEAAAGSSDPGVRAQVIRLAERFVDIDDGAHAGRALAILSFYNTQPSFHTDLHLALSAGVLAGIDTPEGYDLLLSVLERRGDVPVFRQAVVSGLRGKEAVMLARVTEHGGGPIVAELSAALVKAVEEGELSIGSLVELIDSDMFDDKPEQRLDLLGMLGQKMVELRHEEVALLLIDRMSAPDAPEAEAAAILAGMQRGMSARHNPIQLDGEPEVFQRWRSQPPATLAQFMPLLEEGQVFRFEKVLISDELAAVIEHGRTRFEAFCSECHGSDGAGKFSQGPPLAGSEWVHGNARMLSALVLHGVGGPIEVAGTVYRAQAGPGEVEVQPEMVGFANNEHVNNHDLAAILTYVRNAWGNSAPQITEDVIVRMREETAGRDGSYTPAELKRFTPFDDEVLAEAPKLPQRTVSSPGWLNHRSAGMAVMMLGVLFPLLGFAGLTYLVNRA